jgi:hypothetical protein
MSVAKGTEVEIAESKWELKKKLDQKGPRPYWQQHHVPVAEVQEERFVFVCQKRSHLVLTRETIIKIRKLYVRDAFAFVQCLIKEKPTQTNKADYVVSLTKDNLSRTPTPGHEARTDVFERVKNLADEDFESKESKALQDLTRNGCKYTPELIATKKDIGENRAIWYILMQKVPGQPLGPGPGQDVKQALFWRMDNKKREDVRAAFKRAWK